MVTPTSVGAAAGLCAILHSMGINTRSKELGLGSIQTQLANMRNYQLNIFLKISAEICKGVHGFLLTDITYLEI